VRTTRHLRNGLLPVVLVAVWNCLGQPVGLSPEEELRQLYRSYGQQQTPEAMLDHAQRFLTLAGRVNGTKSDDYRVGLARLAFVHQTLGDYSRAETYRQQELRTTLSLYGEQSQEAASSFVAAAELHLAIGDVELAIQEQRRAISIIDGLLRKSSERRSLEFKKVGLQEKLAIMLLRKPDVPAAIRLQLETIELARSTLGTNFEKFVNGLEANLALGYLFGKEYDKSEKLYRQVLSRVSADSKLPPAAVPSAKLHLATLYAMMDRLNEAEPLYREALASTEQSLGKDAEFVMLIRLKFGELLARKGEFKLAEELLQRRLESESKSKGPDNASRRVALCRLVMLELDRRQPSAALGYAREVEVIRDRQLANLMGFAAERQLLAYQTLRGPYDLLASIGAAGDLAQAVLRNKALVQDSLVEDRRIADASRNPGVWGLRTELRRVQAQLAEPTLVASAGLPTKRRLSEAEMSALQAQQLEFQQKLARLLHQLNPSVGGSFKPKTTLVQSLLPDSSVLLEFIRYHHYLGRDQWEVRYGVVLIGSTSTAFKQSNVGEPAWVPLGAAEGIETDLRRYTSILREGRSGDEAVLKALAQRLIAPVLKQLPKGVSTLVVSPDAGLNFVSFGTLLMEDGKFLGEKFHLRYVASGRDLVGKSTASPTRAEAVVFANPAFGAASSVGSNRAPASDISGRMRAAERQPFGNLNLGPLPGTQQEAEFIQASLGRWRLGGRQFTQTAATEAALNGVRSPRVLHLATHGFFLGDLPEPAPAGEVSAFGPANAPVPLTRNAMFNSGLALAGAKETLNAWKRGEVPPMENDGILTAEEVAMLNLQGTWLVVLSACDTGLGELRNGEGVLGLRRGFVQAGAQNLLMTLWPISDKWSVEIMKAFYDKAMVTGDAPQAMAEVQAEWLAKLRKEKGALLAARIAGPFVLTSRGKPAGK
jgi:CHAT domain-containing protein/tetratricopeptide (TPR) repeat protein